MKLNLLISILFMLFIASCNNCNSSQNKTNERQKIVAVVENKEEDFNKFIKLFYSDNSFQISRINFPLNGKHNINNGRDFESKILYKWNKEDWGFLKNIFPNNNDSIIVIDVDTYKRRITKTNTLVTEYIFIENSGYTSLRKFAIKNGKWYLINYEVESY